MSFLGFIGILLLLLIVLPIIRIVLAVFSATRRVKREYNQANSQSQYRAGGASAQSAQTKRKQYAKSMGEYVEFEEVSPSEDTATESATTSEPRRERTAKGGESQVSDAVYEEIP